MTVKTSLRLTPLEIASGYLLGEEPSPPLPQVDRSLSPLQALRDAVLPALARPPCLVSFSGGRDSSAVLAVAADVARREGLALPIPVTIRVPNVPETVESEWQELVVDHLGLTEWDGRTFDAELDLIGPVAQAVLLRHGLLWPPNAYIHQPLLAAGRGGSLMSGVDGDGLFGWRWGRVAALLARRIRPVPRDVLRIALAFAPAPIRTRRERIRNPLLGMDWLRPTVQQEFQAAFAEELAREPRRWDRFVQAFARARYIAFFRSSFQVLADEEDVLPVHPLLDARFLAAIAAANPRFGLGERRQAMPAIFGELLPTEVVNRETKANFNGVAWGPHARAFAQTWSGGGAGDLVDVEALRAEWLSAEPHFGAALSLQVAWLAGNSDSQ